MYKKVKDSDEILRTSDGVFIPKSKGNNDYLDFLAWKAAGNTPDEAQTKEEKEQERIDRKNEQVKRELERADIKIIRAIIEQNQARIDAYKEEQRLRRLELIPPG